VKVVKRDELLQVRVTRAELVELRTAAIDEGKSVSELVRERALEHELLPLRLEET